MTEDITESVDMLKRMVSIYSPTGQEGKLVEYLRPKMAKLGYSTSVDKVGNLIGKIGSGQKEIMLVGHLDTVPGEIDVRIEDGNLYGRGSVDAKASLASFVDAGRHLKNSKTVSLIVVGVVEEETTSKGAYQLLDDFSPDYVVVGEPSSWDGMTLGYRGSFVIDYALSAPKTHRGESSPLPAEQAVEYYQGLKNHFCRDGNSGFFDTSVRLTKITTDVDPFKDRVKMHLNVRITLGAYLEKLKRFALESSGPAEIEISRMIPPVRSSKRGKLVSAFLGAIRDEGGRPKFKLKTGTADMNIFADHWEAPIVSYGPGDSSMDHTPNEHLKLAEYHKAVKVLFGMLKKMERSIA